MKNTKENQSGFGTLTVLLVIVVIAVVGVTGWVVYDHNHKANSKTSTTATDKTNQQKSLSNNNQQAQFTQQSLVIKEWGIQLPLTDTIKDAYYIVGKDSSDGPGGVPTTMWLSVKSLTGAKCDPANNNAGERGAVGALLRLSPTDVDAVSGQPLTEKYPNGTRLGRFYYAYQSWATNNPCGSDSTLQPIDAAFASSSKSQMTY